MLNCIVVDSAAGTTDTDGSDFFQISSVIFNEIRITTTNTQNDPGALLDNLQFSVVPVPTSLALLSLGSLGLLTSRRN